MRLAVQKVPNGYICYLWVKRAHNAPFVHLTPELQAELGTEFLPFSTEIIYLWQADTI